MNRWVALILALLLASCDRRPAPVREPEAPAKKPGASPPAPALACFERLQAAIRARDVDTFWSLEHPDLQEACPKSVLADRMRTEGWDVAAAGPMKENGDSASIQVNLTKQGKTALREWKFLRVDGRWVARQMGWDDPIESREIEKPLLKPDIQPKKSLIPSDARSAKVKAVYDGDTFQTESGEKVRFIGVDTPEREGKDGKPEPFYEEAKAFTKKMCEGKEVFLELDVEKKDKYERTLAYVWVRDGDNELMVNAELIRNGFAYVYTVGNNNRHGESLLECQRDARRNGRGFWKDYVFAAGVVATPRGNAYHKPTCKDIAERTDLRKFQDAGEALDQGLHPCRNCKP